MSIRRSRLGPIAIFVMFVGLPWGDDARTAAVTFQPRIEVGAGREGNVAVVGSDRLADNVLALGVDLELAVASEVTQFSFRYRPIRFSYRTFTQLNHDDHRLTARVDHSLSERSSISFDLSAFRGQYQGIDPSQPEQPITLVPRTNIAREVARFDWETESSERSTWSWGVGAAANRFEDTPFQNYENSDLLLADVGFDRGISERVSVGFAYDFQNIDYELGDTLQVHTLLFVTMLQLGANSTARFGIGGFRAAAGREALTEPSFEMLFGHEVGERTSFSAGVTQRVSPGTGLQQATRDTGGFLLWSYTASRRVSLRITGGYWRRDDLGGLAAGVEVGTRTALTAETLTWTVLPPFSINLLHRYNRQLADDPLSSGLDTDFHSGGLFLRWSWRGV